MTYLEIIRARNTGNIDIDFGSDKISNFGNHSQWTGALKLVMLIIRNMENEQAYQLLNSIDGEEFLAMINATIVEAYTGDTQRL